MTLMMDFRIGMCRRNIPFATMKITATIHLFHLRLIIKYKGRNNSAVLWNINPRRLMAKNGIGRRSSMYSNEFIYKSREMLFRMRSVLMTIPLKQRNNTNPSGRLSEYRLKKRRRRIRLIAVHTNTKKW